MKLLIVDDSKVMRMLVRRSIRQAGVETTEIFEAADGIEALAVIRATPPDIVLADWNMPNMNGLELLQAARSEGFCGVFGMVTTESADEQRQKAADAGANFLLPKPFTPDAMSAAISRHF